MRPAAEPVPSRDGRHVPGQGGKRFISESWAELKKVDWPGQQQLIQGTVVVLIAARRENTAHRWRDAAWPLLVALALSLAIIMGIGAGRAALTDVLHLPF